MISVVNIIQIIWISKSKRLSELDWLQNSRIAKNITGYNISGLTEYGEHEKVQDEI